MKESHPTGKPEHKEESTAAGARAAQMRNSPGKSSAGPGGGEPAEGVLTLVCFECGNEYHFADQDPPEEMECDKCGNKVFRSFFSPVENTEVTDDFRDSTQRDMDPDDAEGEATVSDVTDLNRD